MAIFEEADAKLLPGFERRTINVEGNEVLALIAGEGPPLLLLHGDPQTHLCWHRIAPALVQDFTVVLTDVRGRGEGHIAPATEDARLYSKRAMADEQVSVMRALGFFKFSLVGHDRGARVARRLTLDHPEAVQRLAVLDIVPALNLYENFNAELAQDYFYFNFLTQPSPVPEKLISGASEDFMRQMLFGLTTDQMHYDPLALAAYLTSSTRSESIVAMCECFRAGFHVDRVHDATDRKAGRKITCPTLVGWGEKGVIGQHLDMRAIWSEWCDNPLYAPMPSGHFIPEEAPAALLTSLQDFLAQ